MTDRNLTEEQALALWERAARLQAESAARGLMPSASESTAVAPVGDYSLHVVRRSAIEAGISEEFVDLALQELTSDGASPRKSDEWADRFLGDEARMLRVSRVIDQSIEQVYQAMRRVLPNAPFGLSLSGIRGGDPLEGGIMTFEVPNTSGFGGPGAATSKAMFSIRHWADIPEIQLRIRAIPGDGPRTEIECSAQIAHARRMNYWVGICAGGAVGLIATGIGGAIAAATLGPTAIALKFAFAGSTGVAGYLGMARTWRPIYRFGQEKGREGMDRLLDAIVVDMQTGGAFTPRVEVRPESQGPGLLGDLGL
jgi:hypothetical protein